MGNEKEKAKKIEVKTPVENAGGENPASNFHKHPKITKFAPASSKPEDTKTTSKTTSKTTPKTSKTTAIAKVKNRVPMKYSKKSRKKPLPKVVIKDAEIVEKKAPSAPVKVESKAEKSKKPEKENSKETKKMKLPRVRRIHVKIRYIITAILLIACTAFFGKVAAWENNYIKTMEGTERQAALSGNDKTDIYDGGVEVDDKKPTETEIAEYEVAPNKPRYFTILTLGIRNARVVEIGRTNSGSLDTPYSIYNVGWYTGSALPGQSGVTVMDAHGGDLGNGVFKKLPLISIGDEIKIEMGDKKTFYTYVVKEVATKPIGEEANKYMSTVFQPVRPGVPTLSLITCTGEWYQESKTYSHRFFVRAELRG